MIRAVGLDVDGTLYPNHAMRRRSLLRVLRRLRFFLAYRRVRQELRRRGAVEDFYGEQARLLGRQLGISPERARRRIDAYVYRGLSRSVRELRPYPGLRDFLGELAERGIPLGLLSDFPFADKLESLELPAVWQCRICAEEVGALKPNPEAFRELAACLNCDPSELLYVGNSYHNDVLGAHRAGMQAAHLGSAPSGSPAVVTFRSYAELMEWLRPRLPSSRPPS